MPRYQGVYQDAKGGWYFKATVGRDPLTGLRRQVTRRGFATASTAAKARREFLEAPPVRSSRSLGLTVDDLLDVYFEGLEADGHLTAKTRYDYRRFAELYVRPLLGKTKVRDLTADAVLEWQRRLSLSGSTVGDSLAPNTVRLARAPLAGAAKLAVELGLLASNPVRAIPRPPARHVVPRYWTPDQARAFLLDQADDRLYALWAFLLSCGVRIGECVWLRWGNVDLAGRRVRVVEFATRLGWEVTSSTGKSASAVRTIDLDDAIVEILHRQREMQRRDAEQTGYRVTDFVFTTQRGGPLHPATVSRLLATRSQRAGLPRLTAHGLRHTSATLMLDNGVAAKVAAERLGHADPTLFANLYSHVTPTMQRDAADKIGRALFG